METTCGCCSRAMSWISRRKRSALTPADCSSESTFTTTSRSSDRSCATNTRDIPPPPSSRSTRYPSPSARCNVDASRSLTWEGASTPLPRRAPLLRAELTQHLAQPPHLGPIRRPVVGTLRRASPLEVLVRAAGEVVRRRAGRHRGSRRRIGGARRGCHAWRSGTRCGGQRPARRCARVTEQHAQRRVERLGHRDLALLRHHHALELGDAAALGAQIERLHVDQRSLDRDHEQLAAQHFRAALVPQRDLARDLGVLVDPVRDLVRTEHETLPREAIDRELAEVWAVVPRHHPRREVVLLPRRERTHEDELRLALTRQPHHHVAEERLAS